MNGRGGVRWLIVAASAVMLGAVVAGMCVLGPPSHQRELRLDQRRVANLATLSASINFYWTEHKSLPADLATIDSAHRFTRDPVSGAPYDYAVTGSDGYRLCAVFAAASESDGVPAFAVAVPPVPSGWDHPAGKHCFNRSMKAGSGALYR